MLYSVGTITRVSTVAKDSPKIIATAMGAHIWADDEPMIFTVTEIADDPHARALEIVTLIAEKSPSGTRLAKALIETAESGAGEAAVLMAESVEQAKLIGGAHQKEIVAANMAGRKPTF